MSLYSPDTILRMALPLMGIAIMLRVARMRRLSFAQDLGLRWPAAQKALPWFLAFLVLCILEELVWNALGLPSPPRWGNKFDTPTKMVRVVAMVAVAPVAEELMFRGLLFHTLRKTALQEVGAIFITAVGFTALHFEHESNTLVFILLDALFYGWARCATGSTFLTMAFHCFGNAYAAYQRF